MAKQKWTTAKDDNFDKKNKLVDGSKADKALDAKRGLPDTPAPAKKAPAKKKSMNTQALLAQAVNNVYGGKK